MNNEFIKALDMNKELIRINSELVEVNNGWQQIAVEMLCMLKNALAEREDHDGTD